MEFAIFALRSPHKLLLCCCAWVIENSRDRRINRNAFQSIARLGTT
jgi:hypothetical protein